MASKKISDLALRANVDDTVQVPVDDATQSWRTTAAQWKAYIQGAIPNYTSVNGATALTTADSDDSLFIGDTSATTLKKVTVSNLLKDRVSAKTTTYVMTANDDLILCSGSAFTVTLPDAATNAGKVIKIKKTDSSLTNIITIARGGSDTIAENTTGLTSTSLNTMGETLHLVAEGTAWQVIDRQIPCITTAYTPVLASSSNVSGLVGTWRRFRNYAECEVFWTMTGTGANTIISISVPFTVDTTQITGYSGIAPTACSLLSTASWENVGSGYEMKFVVYLTSTTGVGLIFNGESAGFNMNRMTNTSKMKILIRIPVLGWNG